MKAPQQLVTGGTVYHTDTSLTVIFDEVHYSLSTGQPNGGFHHTLGVRNQQMVYIVATEQELPGGSASAYLAQELTQMGIPVNFGTAIMTAADMTRHVYVQERQDDVIIEVILTAGLSETVHRAGDGWLYSEKDGNFFCAGTINMLIFTNKALTDSAMVKAVITATEAKAAALADLQIKSIVTGEPATGTATDGLILTVDTDGDLLTDTGTFSLWGDTLAKAVRRALQESLADDSQAASV